MQFKPYSDKEISEMNLWPKGEYDFEFGAAEEKVSSSGNDMIVVEVKLYNAEGRSRMVTDFLLPTEAMAYKLKHACEAVGLLDSYEAGTLNAVDLTGRGGRCKLGIQSDKKGQYPDKNVINDYVVDKTARGEVGAFPPKSKQAMVDPSLDDEIPF